MKQNSLTRMLVSEGYYNLRVLPNGVVIGLYDFIFTVGLCYGLDETGYSGRYCYPKENKGDAVIAVLTWNGLGQPSGQWVAHK